MSEINQKRLFEQFPPVSAREWIDRMKADLKDADFDRKMIWRTGEGFNVMPFYSREDLERLNHINGFVQLLAKEDKEAKVEGETLKKIDNCWLVRQDIRVEDFKAANSKALGILMKGVNSLGFIIKDPESITEKNFDILLRDIIPEGTEINIIAEGKAREIVSILAKITGKNGHSLSSLRGAVEADPLGRLMMNGTLCIPVEAGLDYLASLTKETLQLPEYRNIRVTGSAFRNAGSGIIQELAFSLSVAVEYLTRLTERGIDPAGVASKMRFCFGTGPDYFMEIAKLRAARVLWSLIADGYGCPGSTEFRMQIHSVTNRWNMTIYDPYVNMLRTQTEAMSAILGGADSLTVHPFDIAGNEPGEFSERIARNQQLILKEEAYFGSVTDPASGSYYIETLTSIVAENAWKLFLEIEDGGGFLSGLKSGTIQDHIERSAREKKENISRRKEILLGTNQYPAQSSPGHSHSGSEISDPAGDKSDQVVRPVRTSRAAEDMERIRITVDNAPRRPVVFLLQAGNKSMRRARAQFSSSFFGCAGYRVLENEGYEDIESGIDDSIRSEADIIVICSSDEEYHLLAPQVLNRAGSKAIIVIAGNPTEIDMLKDKGLINYISLRSDLGESLRYYNECLGIKSK